MKHDHQQLIDELIAQDPSLASHKEKLHLILRDINNMKEVIDASGRAAFFADLRAQVLSTLATKEEKESWFNLLFGSRTQFFSVCTASVALGIMTASFFVVPQTRIIEHKDVTKTQSTMMQEMALPPQREMAVPEAMDDGVMELDIMGDEAQSLKRVAPAFEQELTNVSGFSNEESPKPMSFGRVAIGYSLLFGIMLFAVLAILRRVFSKQINKR